jgi:predicted RNA-binding Zn-ribbon protein involved in translation (DUF1610 family)
MASKWCVACSSELLIGASQNYFVCSNSGEYGVHCHKCDTRFHVAADPANYEAQCPKCGNRTAGPPSIRTILEFNDRR